VQKQLKKNMGTGEVFVLFVLLLLLLGPDRLPEMARNLAEGRDDKGWMAVLAFLLMLLWATLFICLYTS
jgi:hypothetical protein